MKAGSKTIYFLPEHEAFRLHVRDFLNQHIRPHLQTWEQEKKIAAFAWEKLGEEGFLGLSYSKSIFGQEKDFFYSAIFLEELGYLGFGGFRVSIAVHAYMATAYLANHGSRKLQDHYLQLALQGKKIAALAITEPQAGSDLNNLLTTADKKDGCYVLNGSKRYIANGTIADYFIVAVKTNQKQSTNKFGATGVSLLVVDKETPGLTIKAIDTLGWHCAATAEILFNEVHVPETNLIGSENQGFLYLMKNLQLERLVAGLMALGEVSYCLDVTCEYLKQRQVYGAALGKLQTVRHRLAHLKTEVSAIKQLAYHGVWLYQTGEFPIEEAAMVKLKATELAKQVSHECMQLAGAAGFQQDSAISRIYRDAPAATIAAGASEVLLDIIAQFELDCR